jgi:anion transporter
MKFGKQLELGTYEPWRSHYISYARLKRIIVRLVYLKNVREGKIGSALSSRAHSFIEHSSLGEDIEQTKDAEKEKLIGGHLKPTTAYTTEDSKRDDCDASEAGTDPGTVLPDGISTSTIDFFGVLQEEIDKINNFYIGKLAVLRVELMATTDKFGDRQFAHHTSSAGELDLIKLRDTYVELAALRSYSELNKTGFYKILKKYDKMVGESPMQVPVWLPIVNQQPFTEQAEPTQLMELVAQFVSRDKLLEWELFATEEALQSSNSILPAVRTIPLVISLSIFAASHRVTLIYPEDPCAERCLSMLLLIVSLWVTEAIPYFATGLLILPLSVMMDVFKDDLDPMQPMARDEVANKVMNSMFNHTSWLLMGGYAISSAISRCKFEILVASHLQSALGHRPRVFILAVMFLGLFLSMWISNHTAPILCSTIILPIMKDLPPGSQFTKALLLGLACACNFGGMMTPISSLQNVLAVTSLEHAGIDISFGTWIMISLPFGVICTVICWALILGFFNLDDVKEIPLIVRQDIPVGHLRTLVMVVLSLICVLLFATSSATKGVFGDIGMISLIFLVTMFGSGLLTEVDFNSMSWHTLCLIGGGNVLGKAVGSSGLLIYVTHDILSILPLDNPWLANVGILVFVCLVGTFVSHTVAAIILMPIIVSVGVTLEIPEVVVIGSALAISGAMALPFSSFPNVNAVMLKDDMHQPFLSAFDVVKIGAPTTVVTIFLISTLGMGLINTII